MPRYILKIDNLYCEWSTIVDAPVTSFMPLEKFKVHYQNEYGNEGMRQFEERMERVEAKGVSAYHIGSAAKLIAGNRAGPAESHLDKKRLLELYADED